MPSFDLQRAIRLTLIALYAMATMLVATTFPTSGTLAQAPLGSPLPNGEIAAFCHSGSDGTQQNGDAPSGADHRACCATCLIAGAPGLDVAFDSALPQAPTGHAVEAGFTVSERTTVDTKRPVSRGPPSA